MKQFARNSRLISKKEFPLEDVVRLLDSKLQLRLSSARLHIDKHFPFANSWIDLILSERQLPERSNRLAKSELTQRLLDLVLATDVILALKDNQGRECLVSVDVTANPAKEKGKLNTIQGRREDGEPSKFNRNSNLPSVRQQLGIAKHLVLVFNPENPPDPQVLLSQLYAFVNQPAKTGVINLHARVPQASLDRETSSKVIIQALLQEQNPAKLIAAVKQLSEQDLIATVREVQDYFKNRPQQPPSQAQQLAIEQEIERLESRIDLLWQQQQCQAKEIEQMQKNPFNTWDRNYQVTLTQAQQTLESIGQSLTQKQQLESQLKEWKQQEGVYQDWVNAPLTKQMQKLVGVLSLPLVQERINQLRQKHRQQAQTQPESSQEQKGSTDRRRGISL